MRGHATGARAFRAAIAPPPDQERPVWVGAGAARHVEITPRLPEHPCSDDELRAVVQRIADPEQGLAAMAPALWPGWWSMDLTELPARATPPATTAAPLLGVAHAARRVWSVGVEDARLGHGGQEHLFIVLVYDLDTAARLRLAPASDEAPAPADAVAAWLADNALADAAPAEVVARLLADPDALERLRPTPA